MTEEASVTSTTRFFSRVYSKMDKILGGHIWNLQHSYTWAYVLWRNFKETTQKHIELEHYKENIQNISKSQEDMITSQTNPKDIKISKRKIFSIRPKSTTITIKMESSQVEKNTLEPPLLGVSFTQTYINIVILQIFSKTIENSGPPNWNLNVVFFKN